MLQTSSTPMFRMDSLGNDASVTGFRFPVRDTFFVRDDSVMSR